MAQDVAQVLYVNMETVRKSLPALYELNNTAYGMLSKSAEKFRISVTPNSTDFRAPIKTGPPASFGTFSMAGGSLGTGGGFTTQQFSQTYFPLSMAVDVNLNAMVATSGGANLSVINAWKENMKDAMPSFQRMADASFHNIGGANGKVATATALSTLTYTCETSFAADLIQMNMPLEVVTGDGVTWRTSGVSPDNLPTVSAIDKSAGTFTVTNAGGLTLAATDQFFFRGAVAAGSPPTQTWLNGLYYFHTTSTSGSILGLTKTAYDIMPNLVNAAGSLVPAHAWQLKAKVRQRRGVIPKKYKGLIHDAQAAQIRNLGLSISEIHVPVGQSFKATDVAAGVGDTIMFGDVEHLIDVHQDKTRIDWLVPDDNWCRVYGQELDFYKAPSDGRMIFEGRNSSGTVTAKWSFFLVTQENLVCVDPGKEGVIYGLTIPSGF